MAAVTPGRTRSAASPTTVRGRIDGRSKIGYRVLEVTVSLLASAVIATMVVLGGSAVQVTSATPLPAGNTRQRFILDPDFTPEGERIPRTVTPTPDPMTWCRPLSGSTICIREQS